MTANDPRLHFYSPVSKFLVLPDFMRVARFTQFHDLPCYCRPIPTGFNLATLHIYSLSKSLQLCHVSLLWKSSRGIDPVWGTWLWVTYCVIMDPVLVILFLPEWRKTWPWDREHGRWKPLNEERAIKRGRDTDGRLLCACVCRWIHSTGERAGIGWRRFGLRGRRGQLDDRLVIVGGDRRRQFQRLLVARQGPRLGPLWFDRLRRGKELLSSCLFSFRLFFFVSASFTCGAIPMERLGPPIATLISRRSVLQTTVLTIGNLFISPLGCH